MTIKHVEEISLDLLGNQLVVEITELLADQVGNYIDASLNERLLGILSTKVPPSHVGTHGI